MSSSFLTQLQPFEENQSPSPIEEIANPYELSLHHLRSRSPTKNGISGPPSPTATVNTLQRQLSGDPDNPPPAWQRRPSFNTNKSGVSSRSVSASGKVRRSPSETSPISNHSNSRRVPNLTMTATRNASGQMLMHGSPTSALSIDDPTLTLPQPAFRRRRGGSNRSSISSNQDLSSLTSEELWAMDQEVMADMSNPLTRAAERPLDTVRRMSSRVEHSPYRTGLPQDIIWPTAPVEDFYVKPSKSRSVTSMASLRGPTKSKILSRQNSRLTSIDTPGLNGYTKSAVTSPVSPKDAGIISSNNSSSTSLASHVLKPNQSSLTLSRPPSVYYSRDILSSLAPREGGYAIAATMGNGLGAVGALSVDERRRSGISVDERPRSTARAPVSRSAGMGRWSLDGGEHYGRPYGTPSNATTSTSFGRGTSASDPSPPAEDDSTRGSYLPAGAMSPAGSNASDTVSPPPPSQTNVPSNPSPLGRDSPAVEKPMQLSEAELQGTTNALSQTLSPQLVETSKTNPGTPTSAPHPPPVPVTPVIPLNTKKSKKELKAEAKAAEKEAKAAEKAKAAQAARQQVEQARQAALKREADKALAKKQKEEAKRKEKEEKQRKKAEKKSGLKAKLKSASQSALPRTNSTTAANSGQAAQKAPPVPVVPNQYSTPKTMPATPTPPTMSRNQSGAPSQAGPSAPRAESRTVGRSGPPVSNSKPKLGMFGTIKKRWSSFTDEQKVAVVSSSTSRAVPATTSQPRTDTGRPSVPPVIVSTKDEAPPTPPKETMVAPQPISDLPPRSTSHMHIANSAGRSESPHSARSNGGPLASVDGVSSPLVKSLSRDSWNSGSPSSMKRGSSVRGPRPMPRSPHSPDLQRIEGDNAATSFFEQQQAAHELPLPDLITPSMSRDSGEGNSSLFSTSKGSQTTDLATPFTSDGSEVMENGKAGLETPEREGSGTTVTPVSSAPVIATH